MSKPPPQGEVRDRVAELCENVQLVVRGKPEVVRLAAVALVAEGTCCSRTCRGSARHACRSLAAASKAPSGASSHQRPAALGHPRLEHLSTRRRVSSLPAGPDVRERDPGRRDQPGHAQDPGRPARGDERGRLGRRRHARAADPFIVLATQNPAEYQGTFALPEIAARPVHDARAARLSAAEASAR